MPRSTIKTLTGDSADSNAVLYGADHEILESSLINRKEEAEGKLWCIPLGSRKRDSYFNLSEISLAYEALYFLYDLCDRGPPFGIDLEC